MNNYLKKCFFYLELTKLCSYLYTSFRTKEGNFDGLKL